MVADLTCHALLTSVSSVPADPDPFEPVTTKPSIADPVVPSVLMLPATIVNDRLSPNSVFTVGLLLRYCTDVLAASELASVL